MTSSAHPFRLVIVLAALTSALSACCFGGGRQESPEQAAARNIERLRRGKARLEQEIAAYQTVAAAERGGSNVVLVTVDPRELTAALRSAVPFSFPASSLDRRVGGEMIIERISDIRFEGRKTQLTLVTKGRGIKLNVSVPGPYKRMANELVGGIKSGLSIGLKGDLYVENGRLFFKGKASKIKLKKYNKKDYQNMIRGGVNQKLLDRPHVIDLYPVDAGRGRLSLKAAQWISGRLALVFAK